MSGRRVNRILRFFPEMLRELSKDNATMAAAGLSYYAFLSALPLIVGLISLLSFVFPAEEISKAVYSFIQKGLPVPLEFIQSNVSDVLDARGTLGIASMAVLLFSGTAVLSALSQVINGAWDLKPRPVWIRKPWELLVIILIGMVVVLMLGASVGLSLLDNLGIPINQDMLATLTSFILVLITFLLIYKYMPNTKIKWRNAWPGALLAALLFELALNGFSFFLHTFANYRLTYGALASVVIYLTWLYISSFILILGVEVNVALERI